jgi:hypothetical protein
LIEGPDEPMEDFMRIKGANAKVKPRAWSIAAKRLIEKVGRKAFADGCKIGPGYLSSLHNGSLVTSPEAMEKVATFALGKGVCLTPADMGRPDLAKKLAPIGQEGASL